jgi:hypothetical protein
LTNRWWSGTGGRFFSSSGSLFYPVKKYQKKIKFLHVFANLWDSGKSAALELEPKTFLILYQIIISFKNHYRLEFMHIKMGGQTDRLKNYIYRFNFNF